MRKWARLAEPYSYADPYGYDITILIHKLMIYQNKDQDVYVFLYKSPDAMTCCAVEETYDSLAEAEEQWADLVSEEGWTDIDDPLPGCVADAFVPIRMKVSEDGEWQWGEYEMLSDGKWVEYVRP